MHEQPIAEPQEPARRARLLGVINLSPESMVTDSIALDLEAVAARAEKLRERGVSIMDLGGRSITPDAPPVDDAREQARLAPAVTHLVHRGEVVSVDTWSSETALCALGWGARFINFTGRRASPELYEGVAHSGASICLTFMPYADAYAMRERPRIPLRVDAIMDHLGPELIRARRAGVTDVVIDPNLGIIHPENDDFQKIHQQMEVLGQMPVLRSLGVPIMLYAARKPERLARIMMAEAVIRAEPDYIRTHEPEILQALYRAQTT